MKEVNIPQQGCLIHLLSLEVAVTLSGQVAGLITLLREEKGRKRERKKERERKREKERERERERERHLTNCRL